MDYIIQDPRSSIEPQNPFSHQTKGEPSDLDLGIFKYTIKVSLSAHNFYICLKLFSLNCIAHTFYMFVCYGCNCVPII